MIYSSLVFIPPLLTAKYGGFKRYPALPGRQGRKVALL